MKIINAHKLRLLKADSLPISTMLHRHTVYTVQTFLSYCWQMMLSSRSGKPAKVTVSTSTPPALEDTLCSRVRLRILKLLMDSQTFTTAQIAAKVGVNYVIARAHLEALENGDVLTHVNFGKRIHYYRFKESARANAVKSLLEAWSPTDHG